MCLNSLILHMRMPRFQCLYSLHKVTKLIRYSVDGSSSFVMVPSPDHMEMLCSFVSEHRFVKAAPEAQEKRRGHLRVTTASGLGV